LLGKGLTGGGAEAVLPGVRKFDDTKFPISGNLTHNTGVKNWKLITKNMRKISAPPEVGTSVKHKVGQWVQTDRKTHEEWARFSVKKPTASGLLHLLVANMGHQNAVSVPQKVLAKLMDVSDRTIRTAISALVAGNWIQVIRLGKGKESVYVVNDRVAWGQSRSDLCLSAFSATIIADAADQDEATLSKTPLRRIPTLYQGEMQLPTGPGEDPPSQPHLDGMEPDLPALSAQDELERRGQLLFPEK
jgi:hypothetical protein